MAATKWKLIRPENKFKAFKFVAPWHTASMQTSYGHCRIHYAEAGHLHKGFIQDGEYMMQISAKIDIQFLCNETVSETQQLKPF